VEITRILHWLNQCREIHSGVGEVARETGTVIIASLFERRSAGVYHNTAAIIDANGKLLGKYRKMHVPMIPISREVYFTPGDLGFSGLADTHGSLGVCVCWDQWYPEAARLTALRGAEIIFIQPPLLASIGKEKIRPSTALGVGNHPAEPRDRERLLRRRGKSCRP